MRTFVPGGILCDDGHLISRVDETEGRLEARYACSGLREYVNIGIWKHRQTAEMWTITL